MGMVIYKEDRVCWCCEYYDNMTGYCRNKKKYTHGIDNVCEKWNKAKDLREEKVERPDKKYKKISLFE